MESSNNNSVWYRFPLSVVDKKIQEAFNGDVPRDQLEQSWVDIRIDSIIGIRPFLDDNNGTEEVTVQGTILLTTAGTDFAVDLKPSTVRRILNYSPTKMNADDFTTTPS